MPEKLQCKAVFLNNRGEFQLNILGHDTGKIVAIEIKQTIGEVMARIDEIMIENEITQEQND